VAVLIEAGVEKEISDCLPLLQRPLSYKLDGPAIRCPETEHLLSGVLEVDRDRDLGGGRRPQITTRPWRTRRITRDVDSKVMCGSTPQRDDNRWDDNPSESRPIGAPSPRVPSGDSGHRVIRAISMAESDAVNGLSRYE